MASRDDDAREGYPGERARQGEIILKTRWQRIVFFGGLVGFVVLVLVVALFGG